MKSISISKETLEIMLECVQSADRVALEHELFEVSDELAFVLNTLMSYLDPDYSTDLSNIPDSGIDDLIVDEDVVEVAISI